MKIIIDTNVLISCFAFNRVPQLMMNKWVDFDGIQAYYSTQIWFEINQKFLEGRLDTIFKKSKREINQSKVKEFLKQLTKNTLVIKNISRTVDICRDPKDNMILELAAEIEADYIITGDKDLLVLAKFAKTRIVSPQQFLEVLGNK